MTLWSRRLIGFRGAYRRGLGVLGATMLGLRLASLRWINPRHRPVCGDPSSRQVARSAASTATRWSARPEHLRPQFQPGPVDIDSCQRCFTRRQSVGQPLPMTMTGTR